MSEAMFQGFQVCYGAAAQLLYALALTIFCAPFLGEGRRGRKAAVFLLYLAGWLICDGLALPQGSFGLLLAGLLLAGAGALGLERRLAFLLTLLYLNARISSGLMVESVYFILEELMPFPLEPLERVYLRAALLVSFFLLTHGVLMYAMLYLLRRLLARPRWPRYWTGRTWPWPTAGPPPPRWPTASPARAITSSFCPPSFTRETWSPSARPWRAREMSLPSTLSFWD